MLARILEQAGITTILVTMMPVWSERLGVPRTLAVEHPYGQPMGPAGDRARQRDVLDHALRILEHAKEPGHLEHSDYEWPDRLARSSWHPSEPSPIAAQLMRGSPTPSAPLRDER